MADRLKGKVALITGAAMGMGRECAILFAAEGACVVVADIDEKSARETAAAVAAKGGQALAVAGDVAVEADVQRMVAEGVKRFGALHVLVNNAGLCISAGVKDTTLETWRRQNAVNLDGVFLGVRAALPLMERSGGGAILNISSVAGIGQSLHQEPAYAASKGAIRIFTKVTASQHARDKIRCNSVHPGPVDTEMLHSAIPDPEALQRRLQRVPLGRMGTVAEIVAAVLYLASDDSSYVTGSELVIDGGALAQ